MIVAAVALFTAVGAAGESTNAGANQRYKNRDLVDVEKAYVLCLRSDNAGVVESGLGHAINVKLLFPTVEFPALKKGIDSATRTGATASIRYRAYLAALVFENPAMFSNIEKKVYDDPGGAGIRSCCEDPYHSARQGGRDLCSCLLIRQVPS